jgi:DNA-binding CsgD family transcriptional regulator
MTTILYVAPDIAGECHALTAAPVLLPGPDGRVVVYASHASEWGFEGWAEHVTQVGALTLVQVRDALFLLRADRLPHPTITAQEQAIVRGIAAGLSYRHLSPQLGLAESTIAQYVKRINHKLGAHNRAHLIAIAKDRGMI